MDGAMMEYLVGMLVLTPLIGAIAGGVVAERRGQRDCRRIPRFILRTGRRFHRSGAVLVLYHVLAL